jgi:hypothetical protein
MLGLQVLVLIIGTEVYGNKNWIRIGELSFQPSEFLKVGLVLVLAGMLSQRREYFDSFKYGWSAPLLAAGISTGLVLGADWNAKPIRLGDLRRCRSRCIDFCKHGIETHPHRSLAESRCG